jgi:predicted dehydrogenase
MVETENIIASGVVGVGYLGKFHAEKYASSSKAKLIGIVDIDESRADEIGAEVGAAAFTDYRA